MFQQERLLQLIALIIVLLTSPAVAQQEPITFSDLNWDSARSQNRIAQYIVEKGYGYPTAVIPGGMVDLFAGLRQGESDIMMELWLPNHREAWEEAAIAGDVVSLGEGLSKLTQSAFMMPAYLQQTYPELDHVEDLKNESYRSLFVTADSGGKAALVSCVEGWACHAVNALQVTGYGLDEYVHIIVPETETALHDSLFEAYEKKAPWLGYLDSSMAPALKLDLVRLEEPAHSELCWITTKACAYADTTLLIAARPELLMRVPEVAQMLQNWDLSAVHYTALSIWRIDNDASYADTAIWWLKENDDVWRQWVTEDAAAAIQAALDAGERADGWPDA